MLEYILYLAMTYAYAQSKEFNKIKHLNDFFSFLLRSFYYVFRRWFYLRLVHQQNRRY